MNQYLQAKEADFTRVAEFFKKEIGNIRTGRANTSILDNVRIEAYGAKNPLNAIANISVADGQSIIVAPWDKNLSKEIERGLLAADLGVSIVNEGSQLRLKMPPLTEENRHDLVKKLNEKYEKARIDLRQVRETVKDSIEKAFANKDIAEDDKFRFIKDLDEAIAKHNDSLKQVRDAKEKDIMTI